MRRTRALRSSGTSRRRASLRASDRRLWRASSRSSCPVSISQCGRILLLLLLSFFWVVYKFKDSNLAFCCVCVFVFGFEKTKSVCTSSSHSVDTNQFHCDLLAGAFECGFIYIYICLFLEMCSFCCSHLLPTAVECETVLLDGVRTLVSQYICFLTFSIHSHSHSLTRSCLSCCARITNGATKPGC